MRFVADEGLDGPIVHRLRTDGHEVIYVAEMQPGIDDMDVLAISRQESAVLLTADKDFGDLVFRQRLSHTGILLVRLAGLDQIEKAQAVSTAIRLHGSALPEAFSVLTADSLRIRKI